MLTCCRTARISPFHATRYMNITTRTDLLAANPALAILLASIMAEDKHMGYTYAFPFQDHTGDNALNRCIEELV